MQRERASNGVAAIDEEKARLRERHWAALRAARLARFPGARGRIPNFTGAEAAARVLAGTREWERARVISFAPEAPLRMARKLALDGGKTVLMAVRRLEARNPFFVLEPDTIEEKDRWEAASITGAFDHARIVAFEEVPKVDLAVVGAVAVGRDGARLGNGGGTSDLELAVLRAMGRLGPRAPVAALVHALQLAPADTLPTGPHDLFVDLAITPEEVVRCRRPAGPRARLVWDELDEHALERVPILERLRDERRRRRAPAPRAAPRARRRHA